VLPNRIRLRPRHDRRKGSGIASFTARRLPKCSNSRLVVDSPMLRLPAVGDFGSLSARVCHFLACRSSATFLLVSSNLGTS